jgi:hypothetical protein
MNTDKNEENWPQMNGMNADKKELLKGEEFFDGVGVEQAQR